MPVIPIDSLADPRVAHYRNLKDRELERRGQRFIAEGEYIVQRLLASDFTTESLLLADRRVPEIAPLVPDDVPVYCVPNALMNEILGLKFHSGVMACGLRKPPATLEQILPKEKKHLTLVICPEIANAENIGSMIRIAAAFGADAMLLGEKCHDPFWRQSVRVSMGTIFSLPLLHSQDLHQDIRRLKTEWGVQFAASVLDPSAEPLSTAARPAKFGLMFGNEAQGLAEEWIAACDRKITIPMHWGTDSLNVAVATGIFLYHFTLENTVNPGSSAALPQHTRDISP
jgi:tRNA G18 (ribose-2'-O)-methylase SpoU